MVALEDESTQRNGTVFVTVPGGVNTKLRPEIMKTYGRMLAIPYRRVANHICLLNNDLNPILRLMMLGVTREFRLRLRVHVEGKCC